MERGGGEEGRSQPVRGLAAIWQMFLECTTRLLPGSGPHAGSSWAEPSTLCRWRKLHPAGRPLLDSLDGDLPTPFPQRSPGGSRDKV